MIKKIKIAICFVLFAQASMWAQNLWDINIKPGQTIDKEQQWTGLSLKATVKCNSDTSITMELQNNSDKTLWFVGKTTPYNQFVSKNKGLWSNKEFKIENANFFNYIDEIYNSSATTIQILPAETGLFRWKSPNDTITSSLVFYTSTNESKGMLFWKKTKKIDAKIVVRLSIKVDKEKDPCEEIESFHALLTSKSEEIQKIIQDIRTEKGKKYTDARAKFYEAAIQEIKESVNTEAKKFTKCMGETTLQMRNNLANDLKEVAQILPPEKITPSENCNQIIRKIKENTEQVEGLYLKIRTNKRDIDKIASYKQNLEEIRQQVEQIKKNASACSQQIQSVVAKFNNKYKGALKELDTIK